MRRRIGVALLGVLMCAPGAPAQNEAIPAEVRLGARVETVRRAWPVAPVVVIADSPLAYLVGIAGWTPERRYPVLLDDGSDGSREDIARFVRAFGADRVELLSTGEGGGASREAIAGAVAGAWGAEDDAERQRVWRERGFTPPGVVVADENDVAWTAAAALAAGHGQLLVWADAPKGRLGARMNAQELQALSDAIEAGVRTSGWSWDALGDDLDSVTLCMNAPMKVADAGGETLALTDVIGRDSTGGRWAYCGQVFGSASESAYRAMCSLFLQPREAWLFNGYNQGGGFLAYDTSPAAALLEAQGLTLTSDGRHPGGAYEWAREAVGGVRAGLVFVNTSGMRRWFDLAPGRAYGVDVPMLHVPAAVHFIHSFSAQNLSDDTSIARAWFDQGTFVYAGSVDEPYLRAFVPPKLVARRLYAPAPFGAAARVKGKAWKIAIIGDPLYTLGPAPAPAPAPAAQGDGASIDGGRALDEALKGALGERDFERAARLLALGGRDADVMDLARAVSSDEGATLGPELASAAAFAALRAQDLDLLVRVWSALDPDQREDPRLVNPVWHLAEPALRSTDDALLVGLVSSSVRRGRYAEDATHAARAAARLYGDQAAVSMLTAMMENAPGDRAKKELAKELSRY